MIMGREVTMGRGWMIMGSEVTMGRGWVIMGRGLSFSGGDYREARRSLRLGRHRGGMIMGKGDHASRAEGNMEGWGRGDHGWGGVIMTVGPSLA